MEEIKNMCLRFEPCGSRVTCSPAPTDTDEDFLVLVQEEKISQFYELLAVSGYELGGSAPLNDGEIPDSCKFSSFTLGDVNIIVTVSDVFFDRFMAATSVSKRLNLMDKADRIALFQAVLYAKGGAAHDAAPWPFTKTSEVA